MKWTCIYNIQVPSKNNDRPSGSTKTYLHARETRAARRRGHHERRGGAEERGEDEEGGGGSGEGLHHCFGLSCRLLRLLRGA